MVELMNTYLDENGEEQTDIDHHQANGGYERFDVKDCSFEAYARRQSASSIGSLRCIQTGRLAYEVVDEVESDERICSECGGSSDEHRDWLEALEVQEANTPEAAHA